MLYLLMFLLMFYLFFYIPLLNFIKWVQRKKPFPNPSILKCYQWAFSSCHCPECQFFSDIAPMMLETVLETRQYVRSCNTVREIRLLIFSKGPLFEEHNFTEWLSKYAYSHRVIMHLICVWIRLCLP